MKKNGILRKIFRFIQKVKHYIRSILASRRQIQVDLGGK